MIRPQPPTQPSLHIKEEEIQIISLLLRIERRALLPSLSSRLILPWTMIAMWSRDLFLYSGLCSTVVNIHFLRSSPRSPSRRSPFLIGSLLWRETSLRGCARPSFRQEAHSRGRYKDVLKLKSSNILDILNKVVPNVASMVVVRRRWRSGSSGST